MSFSSIPPQFVVYLFQHAARQGLAAEALQQQLALAYNPLQTPLKDQPDLDLQHFSRLCNQVMRLTQDESIYLPYAGTISPGTLKVLCSMACLQNTLREAIHEMISLHKILRDPNGNLAFTNWQLLETKQQATMVYTPGVAAEASEYNLTPMALFTAHRFFCWLAGDYFDIEQVELTEKTLPLAQSVRYQHYFTCPVHFNRPENRFHFRRNALDLPVSHTKKSVQDFLKNAYVYLFRDVDNHQLKLSERVRGILSKRSPTDFPDQEQICQALHVSSATLRRKLREESTSYQKIKDELRLEKAHRLLAEPSKSTDDIAEILGFSSASAFFRSFKSWTGMTPKQYQSQLQPIQSSGADNPLS